MQSTNWHRVFIGVGSNVGDRHAAFRQAKLFLANDANIQAFQTSPIYETNPVGGPPQGKFLNAVWAFQFSGTPQTLLKLLLQIEQTMGRKRTVKDGPRTIDLDILFFDDFVVAEQGLTIPHPRLHERWFVLKPLWDLAADWIHPTLKKSVCELLDECHADC
ncbi:MAG: 2-amino-4-hydroxy-6-hydroxymethyldihydropteridine diphosphokinase [Candidatus Omnitrophica bacterium CG11_big_fil_rev_8_21_14_0_20_45_26]|uniref:2-amino-4-hydroxy-6-hydroxymethyldihydropteridine pyrophosphokinase n=1 Tax=Candidatus Abzuiibacterium crystallinum TaxID=1974748 RepID=A0A2H0LMP9_9BACT|nr:MAG: 2-amino-4-hydroxy-6-hydroxymethyldihydropteridine diphosphokinase [Candidatus Omnitrophica bacterium CG11_big_fil_rev_8_21_14_0_20_45_26]PIW65229.1 MAG: 2-amino-4-hydroxy-6-hydroxymethyldihydropteridine diphosphokinase [Candidatus Omnitrophica bacterium CG12_big_fil_rev_8_21_14_0_65_45_16]